MVTHHHHHYHQQHTIRSLVKQKEYGVDQRYTQKSAAVAVGNCAAVCPNNLQSIRSLIIQPAQHAAHSRKTHSAP